MRPMSMEPANAAPGDGFDLDMAVATLQSNSTDVRLMLKLLVSQLSEVLGNRIQVERAGGRIRRSDEIKSVQIILGDDTLRAEVEGAGVRCSIGHASGGIRIRSEQVGMDVWLARLLTTLNDEAAHSEQTRLALETHSDRRLIVTQPADPPKDLPKDLPKDATHRLEELEHGLFTSDLSVNEFLLVKETGFHPLGFVMGSSIYHIGLQTRKWGESQELTKLTEAMYTARELAMNRMEEEADELGADGVVGVRLDVNYYEWGSDSAEFIAFGTAVKAEDGTSYRTPWASRSPPTSPGRTSGPSCKPATCRRAWSWARACTTSPIASSPRRWAPWGRTWSCPISPRRSTRRASWP